MTAHVKVPVLPESVAEATVVAWHKNVGDTVKRDENLVDIETDKVILEVPAPCDGVLTNIIHDLDAIVEAGHILAHIEEGEVNDDTSTKTEEKIPDPTSSSSNQAASPSVRKALAEHDLSLDEVNAQVQGSGKDGRLTKDDVEHFANTSQPTKAPSSIQEPALNTAPQKLTQEGDRPEKRVAMTNIRQQIANRAIQARLSTSTITTFSEVDMSPVERLIVAHEESFEDSHGAPLTEISFFVKACVEALKRFPTLNASIEDDDVIYHGYQDIGVTLDSSRGQLVPVLRNAEHMSMADIEQTLSKYSLEVEDGSIDFEALQGGTFTLSNAGLMGATLSTPILNSPQSAVLGLHKIEERAIVIEGEIVVRPMMSLALSYDQRLIDGNDAVAFLMTVKSLIEDPARILLGV